MENNVKPPLPARPRLPPPRPLHLPTKVNENSRPSSSPVTSVHSSPAINGGPRPYSSPVAPPKPPRVHNYRSQIHSLNIENLLNGKDILAFEKKALKQTKSDANTSHRFDENDQVINDNHLSSKRPVVKPIVPIKPIKPLSERPLPSIPREKLPLRHIEKTEQKEKKRQGLVISDLVLAKLRADLDQDSTSFTPKSNLNKLKSISSPSLFHRDVNDSELEEIRYGSGDILTDDMSSNKNNSFDLTDGFFKRFNPQPADKPKVGQKFKIATSQGFSKGVKKWQSFSVHKNKTFNVLKASDLTRNRAETAPIFEEEFDKFSDLHQDEDAALFDHVLVVSLKIGIDKKLAPYISFRFPPKIDQSYGEEDQIMQSIPQFCFPDLSITNEFGFKKSENFSFVLTDMNGGRNFGFCRLIHVSSSKYPEVYCIISPYGLFSIYSQILEEVEKQRMFSATAVFSFLKAVLSHTLPKPSSSVTVSFFTSDGLSNVKKVILERPGDSAIHEHVDLSLLFATLPITLIIQSLTSLLLESKVILCSKSLSLLSSCCHGLISLMYPFTWEHTYIPVLPTTLVDMVCLPTPYLIGLLPTSLEEMQDLPIEEVTVVNLDNASLLDQYAHGENIQLPKQIKDDVKNALEEIMQASRNTKSFGETEQKARNQVITEVFVHSYIDLIGHFEAYYGHDESGDTIIMGKEFYRASQNKEQKKFLKFFMNTQAFQQFTITRKETGPSLGLFENRFAEWKRNRSNGRKSNFKELLTGFKRKLKF